MGKRWHGIAESEFFIASANPHGKLIGTPTEKVTILIPEKRCLLAVKGTLTPQQCPPVVLLAMPVSFLICSNPEAYQIITNSSHIPA